MLRFCSRCLVLDRHSYMSIYKNVTGLKNKRKKGRDENRNILYTCSLYFVDKKGGMTQT